MKRHLHMIWIPVLIALLISGTAAAGNLKIGDPAPEFSLKDQTGKIHTLSDYTGKLVVLYFYPKNDTPGCTREACNLRDNYEELLAKGMVVLGVSYDNAESHLKFIEKYSLPFPLLSDGDKSVSSKYDAKGLLVPKRITYLIGPDGKIQHIIQKVDTTNHASQILELLTPSLNQE